MNTFQTCPIRGLTAFTLLLVSCLATSYAQTTLAHPLNGTWSWTLFSGQCTETLQYRADGVMLSTSGEAVTEWSYTASAVPDTQGFFKVSEISTRHNTKKDCSGDVVDEAGLYATKFIQLNPLRDQLIICKTPSLGACYGPLLLVP